MWTRGRSSSGGGGVRRAIRKLGALAVAAVIIATIALFGAERIEPRQGRIGTGDGRRQQVRVDLHRGRTRWLDPIGFLAAGTRRARCTLTSLRMARCVAFAITAGIGITDRHDATRWHRAPHPHERFHRGGAGRAGHRTEASCCSYRRTRRASSPPHGDGCGRDERSGDPRDEEPGRCSGRLVARWIAHLVHDSGQRASRSRDRPGDRVVDPNDSPPHATSTRVSAPGRPTEARSPTHISISFVARSGS